MKSVVLVHGMWDTGKNFERLGRYLEKRGWIVHTLDLQPNNGAVPLEVSARQLKEYVEKNFEENEKINLIGFSMGGLVSRYYLQRLGGMQRVRKFMTISTPHRGTWTAYVIGKPGVRQMRPNSDFLRDLERDGEMLKELQFTSLWTPFDLMVIPCTSSIISHAVRNIAVLSLLHPWMLINPHTHFSISKFLEDE